MKLTFSQMIEFVATLAGLIAAVVTLGSIGFVLAKSFLMTHYTEQVDRERLEAERLEKYVLWRKARLIAEGKTPAQKVREKETVKIKPLQIKDVGILQYISQDEVVR